MIKPHIDKAHSLWKNHVKMGDTIIDATCGNGHDSLYLSNLLKESGTLYCIDIQKQAIIETQKRLKSASNVQFLHQSHETLPPCSPSLIVYNLGYLPGSDKQVKTVADSTLRSLEVSAKLLSVNGICSIMCYPGHTEGLTEQKEILNWAQNLECNQFRVSYLQWVNKANHPSLLVVEKLK
ncbi:MAG: class I SAM-dependent methyltransferase [Rhabdochlamydiaceae bacterium]|nr:class I SAM-dependent methyltransferase [Candidatus Amphrikana amoebophyrae]